LDALDIDTAKNQLLKMITTQDWKLLGEPYIVHSMISISKHESHLDKILTKIQYKIVQFFSVWSVSDILGIPGIVVATYFFECYNDNIKLQARKVPWIAIAAIVAYLTNNYTVASGIALINTRFVENFLTRSIYEFFIQRFGMIKQTIETNGWIYIIGK